MSQILTRRSLVAAAPAAVVAASLPLAAAVADAAPDAELLQLSREFKRLHKEWQDRRDVASHLEPPTPANQTMDEFWHVRKETGYEDAVAAVDDKLAELDVVANRMRELPAQTLQGLAVKARLAQFDAHLSCRDDMEGPEEDWDWDVKCMEHFVREIERFASTMQLAGGLNA